MTAAEVLPDEEDVRPLVGRAVNNRSVWIFGGALALGAILLFSVLEARRSEVTSPATAITAGTDAGVIAAPPPLAMPGIVADDGLPPFQATIIPPVAVAPTYPTLPGVPRTPSFTPPARIPTAPVARTPAYYDPDSPDSMYIPDAVAAAAAAAAGAAAAAFPEDPPSSQSLARSRTGVTRLLNPSTTVPQGALIQAVLETALDSNRPGFVRAIVSRDVRSFDGSRVLIPRGSRLFGEYKADLADGQNRAFIVWQKLTRPDGVQVAVESPAADPLGRAGVKGNVDTHFLQRFAGAILQSSLDLGVGLATRAATSDTVIIGLPGSTQNATQINPQQNVRPTLKVKHGASVSVFVARDLDFIAVE